MSILVAPAYFAPLEVHTPDPARPADEIVDPDGSLSPLANTGWTACGEPMLVTDEWTPIPRELAEDLGAEPCWGCAHAI